MDKLHLIARTPEIPEVSFGGARLHPLADTPRVSIAPFAGQGLAINDVLKRTLKLSLPPVGQVKATKTARIQWLEQGKWLLSGEGALALQETLAGHAAVLDQSDSFVGLLLSGDIHPVLARLSPLDFATLAPGQTARSELAHLPAVFTPLATGLEVLLPRSATVWAVEQIVQAMKSVAATPR